MLMTTLTPTCENPDELISTAAPVRRADWDPLMPLFGLS